MKRTTTCRLLLPLSLLLLSSTVTGFSTIHRRTTTDGRVIRKSPTQVAALPPDALDPTVIHSTLSQFQDHFLSSSHQLLADASSAAADAPDMGPEWWQSYLQIFKNTLSYIHQTIDGPLRSTGFDQTWGVSIALFTILMRSLLIPLSIQQNKNTEYMKALKPYIKEVKEKFKDNENMKNKALGKLFEDANQNPLSGCAVSLAQLPILLGLYRGIRLLAMDGQLDEPFLWIPSLQGPVTAETNFRGADWLFQGWTNGAPALGWETTLAFLVMPVLLVLTQSFTMSILTPAMDEGMTEEEQEQFEKSQVILKFLPLLIGFFSLQVPAGLTIYWFTTNLFTLSQSLAVRTYFRLNPPVIELPDYWDSITNKDISEMTPEEKREAVGAGIGVGPTMEDLLDEAKFHSFIERTAIRSDSEAWEKVSKGEIDAIIPPELEEWVKQQKEINGAGVTIAKEEDPVVAAVP